MSDEPRADWDPKSDDVQRDQLAAYDEMRERCPVAHSEILKWSIFRHEDVVRVLNDPQSFSNVVSRHLAVPSGMDPPEHTAYRHVIEPYFGPERMAAFEPTCRGLAAGLAQSLVEQGDVEFVAAFAQAFALQSQCAFLGWPPSMYEPLRLWIQENHRATLAQDREAMQKLAREFEGYIDDVLRLRRNPGWKGSDDVTTQLMRERVFDRPLRDDELVSILRNWTVGEIGTIAASIAIVVEFLANNLNVQEQLRSQPSLLPNAIDELLRIHGPLVTNRRITTCPVEIGGRKIAAGERISINWVAANRDGRVFEDPETMKLDRDPKLNLLYGAGIHVCPGAPLASLELRVAMEELLGRTTQIDPVPGTPPMKARYPASGFSTLPIRIR